MSKEKRGGARLEKNLPARKPAPTQADVPTSGGPEEETRGGLSRRGKIILIVAVALSAAILIGFLISRAAGGLFGDNGLLSGLPSVPDYNDAIDPENGDGPLRSEADSVRKEEFYTFLVVGRDTGGGGNTDTIMFCSYDIPNQKLTIMSIPRDTIVDARHPDSNKKINGVWNLGLYYAEKGSQKQGIDYLKEAVGDMTGIIPDFYVIVNWEAFGRLVDAIGGVDFEVPFDMKYSDPTQNLYIDQAAGYRHLSGDDAMEVVRWRHNNSYTVQYADADLGRIRTQQALMKEIIKKCLKIENLTKINEFAEIFAQEVETDLTVGNLLAFAQRAIFGGLEMDNVNFVTMPNRAANGGAVQADPEELLGILNESFNPYVKDLDMSELRVLQYSSSKGYYVYQGTGAGAAPTHSSEPKPAQAVTTQPKGSAAPSSSPSPPPAPSVEPSDGDRPSAKPSADPAEESGGDDEEPADAPSASPPRESEPPAAEESEPPASAPAEPTSAHDPADLGIPMD